MEVRTAKLKQMLDEGAQKLPIETKLLCLAAAARWLARHHMFTLAVLVLDEYRASCLKLSDGTIQDCLGLAGDLLSRDWYLANLPSAQQNDDAKEGEAKLSVA